jgi:hypothetical protein
MRLVRVAVQQRQALLAQEQLQRLAVQVMTHQHLEARSLALLFTLAADQAVARQAVGLHQAQQLEQQTAQLTQDQAEAETRQLDQTMAAQVDRVFC